MSNLEARLLIWPGGGVQVAVASCIEALELAPWLMDVYLCVADPYKDRPADWYDDDGSTNDDLYYDGSGHVHDGISTGKDQLRIYKQAAETALNKAQKLGASASAPVP